MKIAFFTYLTLEFGGGLPKYFIEVSTGLKKRYSDLDMTIITFDEKMLIKILLLYALYFTGKQDRNLFGKENDEKIKQKLGTVSYYKSSGIHDLKKKLQEFDAVYTSNNLLEICLLKYIIGYKNIPSVILGFHIPQFYKLTGSIQSRLHNHLYSSFIYRHPLISAKALHVVNDFDEQLLRKRIPAKKIVKIHYPFDFEDFFKKASLYKYPFKWDKHRFKILWLARLTEQKGVNDLIILITNINKTSYKNRIVWHIVGDGELKNKVRGIVKKWDNIHYLGYVENDYTASIYGENDLFINTSKWESFPYTLLEAQSFGLPVICYNIHGCDDIIHEGKNGYLVDTIDQFKNRIIFHLRYKKLKRQTISKFIRDKFNNELLFKKLYELFMG